MNNNTSEETLRRFGDKRHTVTVTEGESHRNEEQTLNWVSEDCISQSNGNVVLGHFWNFNGERTEHSTANLNLISWN